MSKGKVHNIGTKNKQRKRCIKKEMKEGEKENNMKRTRIEEKGITLVALVITIVILIILATVTINVALGDGGLIDQAKLAAEKTANSIYDEEASLANLTAYLNEQLGEGEIAPPDIPEDTEPPEITSFIETDVTANSITVSVTATDNSGGALKYEYRKGSEAFTEGGITYQFTGLTADTEYTLEVKVTDEAGLFDTEIITLSTDIQAPAEWDTTKVDPVKSADGIVVPVPKGFTASEATGENEVNKGFVIYQGTDSVNDENVDSAQESRNQFVWIPVDEESLNDMYQVTTATLSKSSHGEAETTTSVYSKQRWPTSSGAPGSTNYREPDILIDTDGGDASTTSGRGIDLIKSVFGLSGDNASVMKQWAEMLVNEYEAVYESIKKYDGFYIGRYELTGDTTAPTVQRDKAVLIAATANTWYGLKKACNEIVSTNEVQSIMIYGNMWDETMQWLIDTEAKTESEINVDSSSWGNYYNSSIEGARSPQNSGYSDYWCANNVYDFAGNCYDWTQEAYNASTRVYRGGCYGSSGSGRPTSNRGFSYSYTSDSTFSSRPAMYIK